MVRTDVAVAHPLRELVRHSFDQPASIDKNQSRPVRLDRPVDIVQELPEHLGPELRHGIESRDQPNQLRHQRLNGLLVGALPRLDRPWPGATLGVPGAVSD